MPLLNNPDASTNNILRVAGIGGRELMAKLDTLLYIKDIQVPFVLWYLPVLPAAKKTLSNLTHPFATLRIFKKNTDAFLPFYAKYSTPPITRTQRHCAGETYC